MDRIPLLRKMMLIRAFEKALMSRPDHGFQLLSEGEEAVAVGVCAPLEEGDQLLASGRSIGPALARGLPPAEVMAELLGRVTGTNRGKGGRGHLAKPSAGFFGAHAVVGGNLAIAAGVALAFKLQELPHIGVCIFGDGACGSGALHETLNIAAIWQLPLVLVCNNNQMSVSTPQRHALAPKRLSDLAIPFGISNATVDGMDVEAVRIATAGFVAQARHVGKPAFLECISERFASHSSATRETRSELEMERILERCPIKRLTRQLEAEGILDVAGANSMRQEVDRQIRVSLDFADASPFPQAAEATTDVA